MSASRGAPDGIAVVDKDAGWTSHDVVARARRILGTRKVGHSGTLDPDATGVLVLGVGRGTRLLRFVTELPKTYCCEVVFGTETDTLDASGDVVARHDMSDLTPGAVVVAARGFVGEIEQVPPMVSAVRIGGRRLHELARAGQEVERESRAVTVHHLELEPTDDPLVFRMQMVCSSGTYVRSLAADLGAELGGGAHVRALRRSAVGSFGLDEAKPVEKLQLLPLRAAVRDLPSVTADDSLAADIAHGKVLRRGDLGVGEDPGPWGVLSREGELLAVYQAHGDGRVKPAVVVRAA